MEEFMSPQTFNGFLMFKVTIAIIAAYYFYKFAGRDATAFDTVYRKRCRYIYVIIVVAAIVFSAVQIYAGPFTFSMPWYNISLYGTANPTAFMLETGLGKYANIPSSYATCRWSRLTFEQWNLSNGIANLIVELGLLIYLFKYRKSSVRWNVKIRKFIGYTLLYAAPATIANSLHYFSLLEFSSVCIYVGITYLCCRTYNWDAVPAKLPKESISHPNIPTFEAIPPEDKSRIGIKDYISITKEDIQEDFEALKKWAHKFRNAQYWIGVLLLLLINILFICRTKYGPIVYCDNPSFQKFNVWIKDSYYKGEQKWKEEPCEIDNSLGDPINGNLALTRLSVQTSRFDGSNDNALIYEWYRYYEIITYDISAMGYGKDNGFKYLEDIARKHRGKTTRDNPYNIEDYCATYSTTSSLSSPVYGINQSAFIDLYDEMTIVHYVFCEGNYAYEIRVYHLKDVRGEQFIKNVYFKNPFKIDYILYILVTILIISSILCVIYTYKKQQIAIINPSARKLFNYIVVSTLIQILMVCFVVVMTCINHEHDDEYYITTIILSTGTIINLLLAKYVLKLITQPYTYDYLLPEWYKEKYVAVFSNNVLCSKMSLVLLCYPLFYLATLPLGIFVFIYLLPMAAVFGIAYLINWVFKDNMLLTRPLLQKKEHKQAEFTADTLKQKLQLLKSMLDEGLITQEDYDRKKAEILDKIQD